MFEPITKHGLYHEFLGTRGPGLHHVTFVVHEFYKATEPFQRAGSKPVIEGELAEAGHFASFECPMAQQSFINVIQYSDGGKFVRELKAPPAGY